MRGLACLLLVFTGCDAAPGEEGDGGVVEEGFLTCRGRAFTLAPDQGWENDIATPIVTAAGADNHSAQDVMVPPGAPAMLPGKFAYGTISKDLEDEYVRVSLDDCSGWIDLGDHLTNSDGRVAVPAPTTLRPGVYEVRYQVLGDQTTTLSYLWVLPVGTRVIVSDIDATLTTNDSEVFQQVLDGSYVPVAYPGAVDLTLAHAEIGHVVVYLTGRPYWLTQKTRDWLVAMGCAPGPLHVTDSNGEALPTEGGVGEYKKNYLLGLVGAGYTFDLAYGNATTDIYAYLGAAIPADKVWIIGDHAGEMGTNPVSDTWAPRAAEVRLLPDVVQPFSW